MEVTGNEGPPKSEIAYPVNLRAPLATYIARGLKTVHSQEHQRVRLGGVSQEIVDFYNSPFSTLVKKFSDATHLDLPSISSTHIDLTDPNSTPVKKTVSDRALPHSIPISLTATEVSMVAAKMKAPDPSNYTDFKAHNEMLAELRENFESAKGTIKFKNAVVKVKKFLGGKK